MRLTSSCITAALLLAGVLVARTSRAQLTSCVWTGAGSPVRDSTSLPRGAHPIGMFAGKRVSLLLRVSHLTDTSRDSLLIHEFSSTRATAYRKWRRMPANGDYVIGGFHENRSLALLEYVMADAAHGNRGGTRVLSLEERRPANEWRWYSTALFGSQDAGHDGRESFRPAILPMGVVGGTWISDIWDPAGIDVPISINTLRMASYASAARLGDTLQLALLVPTDDGTALEVRRGKIDRRTRTVPQTLPLVYSKQANEKRYFLRMRVLPRGARMYWWSRTADGAWQLSSAWQEKGQSVWQEDVSGFMLSPMEETTIATLADGTLIHVEVERDTVIHVLEISRVGNAHRRSRPSASSYALAVTAVDSASIVVARLSGNSRTRELTIQRFTRICSTPADNIHTR